MLNCRILAVTICSLISPGILSADDSWPQFRGPRGDGITDKSLPTRWSAEKNIGWRTRLPGEGWSSPVVSGGRIYLTAAIAKPFNANSVDDVEPEAYSLSMIVIDAKSGVIIKKVEVMEQSTERPAKIHSKNSHASPTPIVDGNRIFVHFGYQGTACLTLDGDVIWTNRDLHFRPTHGNGGSPVLVGNHLIFTCDGDKQPKVVALDASTGQIVWETPRPVEAAKTFSFCTPAVIDVGGNTQVIAPGSDCVLALDPATGEIVWDVRYTGYSVVPKPVYDRGRVYISTGFDSSKMLAIRPSGRGVVTDTHVQWRLSKNVPKTPSMIAHDGLIYSISDNGIAQCVDGESGEVVYQERVGGNFSASPLMAGDHIYYTSERGVTTVIRSGRKFKEVSENEIGERTLASLAVVEDDILLRTSDALYRIGR